MNSDGITHITDSTQNDMPIDPATSLLIIIQASDEPTNAQHQVHGPMEQWLSNTEQPWPPNTQPTIDSSRVMNVGQGQIEGQHAHVQETHTTSKEVHKDNAETDIDTAGGSAEDGPSQRLADYSNKIDFYLKTSFIGIGGHLGGHMGSSSATRQQVQRVATNSAPSSGSNERFWSAEVLYYCTFCDFSSTARYTWEEHERKQHLLLHDLAADTGAIDLMCYFCGVNATSIEERAEHIANHFYWQRCTKAHWDAARRDFPNAQLSWALS